MPLIKPENKNREALPIELNFLRQKLPNYGADWQLPWANEISCYLYILFKENNQMLPLYV